MADRSCQTRIAIDSDRDALEALGMSGPTQPVIVAERAGLVVGAAAIEPLGPPEEPHHPMLVARFARAADDDEKTSLLRAVIDRARADLNLKRLLVQVDPMNYEDVRRYELLGFRPAGRGPYHDLGGGMARYVSGYEDATGSLLDLVVNLDASS